MLWLYLFFSGWRRHERRRTRTLGWGWLSFHGLSVRPAFCCCSSSSLSFQWVRHPNTFCLIMIDDILGFVGCEWSPPPRPHWHCPPLHMHGEKPKPITHCSHRHQRQSPLLAQCILVLRSSSKSLSLSLGHWSCHIFVWRLIIWHVHLDQQRYRVWLENKGERRYKSFWGFK